MRHRAAAGGRTEAEKQKNGYREVVAIKKQKNAAALQVTRIQNTPGPNSTLPGLALSRLCGDRRSSPALAVGDARRGRGGAVDRVLVLPGTAEALRPLALSLKAAVTATCVRTVEPARRSRASPAASLLAGWPPMARSNGTSGAAALGG